MARKKSEKKLSNVVIVSQASPGRVRAALRLLDAKEKCGDPKEIRVALKLLAMVRKFVRSGGRFKKRYRRKKTSQKRHE